MAFLLKALGFPVSIPNFPFTVREEGKPAWVVPLSPTRPALGEWRVCHGTRKEDSKPVMIFSFQASDRGVNDIGRELARNALHWAKVLLLPNMLRCYGGTEHEGTIYIATEPCEPLCDVLRSEERSRFYYDEAEPLYKEAVPLGVQDIAAALRHLYGKQLIHGHVGCQTVYVIGSGEWRLFGLELIARLDNAQPTTTTSATAATSSMSTQPSSSPGAPMTLTANPFSWYLTRAPYVLLPYQVAPELGQLSTSSAGSSSGGAPAFVHTARLPSAGATPLDLWGMACLLYEVFAAYAPLRSNSGSAAAAAAAAARGGMSPEQALQQLTSTKITSYRQIPYGMQSLFTKLAASNPERRPALTELVAHSEELTRSDLVQFMHSLRTYNELGNPAQDETLESLALAVKQFPRRICMCVLVQRLLDILKFGPNAVLVRPIVAIAERVQSEDDFARYLAPALVQLYAYSYPLLRYRLLQNVERYAGKMPKATVTKIWPDFVKGFTSRVSSVREYSARAVIHLATRMEGNMVMSDVVPALTQLQRDSDGALRTNATVSLCLLAPALPSGPRGGVLLSGFTRMLTDPFAPSRLVALRSLRSSLEYFTAGQIASTLVPAVSPMTVDAVGEIRELALHLMKAVLPTLEQNHSKLLEEQPQKQQPQQQQQNSNGNTASPSSSSGMDAMSKEAVMRSSYNPLTSASEGERSAEGSKASLFLSPSSHRKSPLAAPVPQRPPFDTRTTEPRGQQQYTTTSITTTSATGNNRSSTSSTSNGVMWGGAMTLSRPAAPAADTAWANDTPLHHTMGNTVQSQTVEDGWDDFDEVTPKAADTNNDDEEEDGGWGEAIEMQSSSHHGGTQNTTTTPTTTTTTTTTTSTTRASSHVDANGPGFPAGQASALSERKPLWAMPTDTTTPSAAVGQGGSERTRVKDAVPHAASTSTPVGGAAMVLKPRKKGAGLGAARLS